MKRNSLFDARKKRVSDEVNDFLELSFNIVDRIHDILEAKGWTQKDLAQKMGKNESEISRWMRGTHNFTISTIVKLEHVLGEPILSALKSDEKRQVKTIYETVPVMLDTDSLQHVNDVNSINYRIPFKALLKI